MRNKLLKFAKKVKNMTGLLRNAFSSKRKFKIFILAYFILQFEWVRAFFIRYHQIRLGKSPKLRELYQKWNLQEQFNCLKKDGYTILNKALSEVEVGNIKKHLASLTCTDDYNPHAGKYKLEEAPPTVNIAGYHYSDLIKIPEIMQLANDPEILAVVQEYLGCTPTITSIQMWWSLVGRASPQYAQLYHRDFDGLKFLKLFVYLTDVGEHDGAHLYIAGSSNLKTMRRPTRFTDEMISKVFSPVNIIKMCGKKGMIFLEDTFGIHKGTLPINNSRLVLQIQYGMQPHFDTLYKPFDDLLSSYDPYINRLFLAKQE